MNRQEFIPRLMTIVSTEESVAGADAVNPAENETNEVSDQSTDVITEEAEITNNEEQTSVEPEAETIASAVESNVSLSTSNPEQVELTPELLATVLGFLKKGVKTKMSIVVSYQAARQDMQLVFIRGNRNIYPAQVERLWKDIANKPVKKFTRPCAVVSAKTVLENNPSINLFDLYGNEVTLGTSDINKMYALVDGQNRYFAVLAHPEADVDLEILDYRGDILELIKIFNTNSKNWDTKDFLGSNIETGKVGGDLKAKATEIQKIINVSDKVATFLATFKRDAVKKSDVVKGKDCSGYDEFKGDRGLRLAMALSYRFGHVDPIKIELIDAILGVYDSLKDIEKGSFTETMFGCIAEMDYPTHTDIKVNMKAKDYGKVSHALSEAYNAYAKLHEDDLFAHVVKLQTNVEKKVKADVAADPVKSKGSSGGNLTPCNTYKAQLSYRFFKTQNERDSKQLEKEKLEAKFKQKDARSSKTLKDLTMLANLKKKIEDLEDKIDLDDVQLAEIGSQFKLFK